MYTYIQKVKYMLLCMYVNIDTYMCVNTFVYNIFLYVYVMYVLYCTELYCTVL